MSMRTTSRCSLKSTRPTGRPGLVGLYVPSDPGAPTEEAANGRLLFEIGSFFEKGLTMGTGQADVKTYNRRRHHQGRPGPGRVAFRSQRGV